METTTIAHDGVKLGSVPSGQSVQVRGILGGQQLLSRLACLGFTPGARLTVLRNHGHGPVIVGLRDTQVALGRGEVEKILVRPWTGQLDE